MFYDVAPMRRILQALLIVAAVPAAIRSARALTPPAFVFPVPNAPHEATPFFHTDFLPRVNTTFVHAATLAELPSHQLVAAWYGGIDEISPDVRIFASNFANGAWSSPRVIETRAEAQSDLRTRVKSLGNPVLFRDGDHVKLFYGVVLFGGWSGATIAMKSSPDAVHWTSSTHLVTSSFLNLGMLVRSEPWSYTDGSIALPIYHEMGNKWGGLARVDRDGRVIDARRIEDKRILIQPWLVPTSAKHAFAFLRWADRTPGTVTETQSDDAGVTWQPVRATPLAHRDSAVASVRLDDGSLLLIYNSNTENRRDLAMVRSADGVHWSAPYWLEHDDGPEDPMVRREYSYPFVLKTSAGRTHVVSPWRRVAIRPVAFNSAWATEVLRSR